MLAGLAAIIVPPLIHLLTRRKFDIAPWGAMQFLEVGQRTRRKLIWEELLLMAVRMGVIAALVLALAAPAETNGWLARFRTRPERDLALVIDRSGSMGIECGNAGVQSWANALLEELSPGDRVAIILAGQSANLCLPLTTKAAAPGRSRRCISANAARISRK